MPYEIRRMGDEFCVMKQGTSERMGCHPSEAKARRQMAALYANEPMMKAALTAASINDLPDSDFAYIEPGGTKDDSGRTVPRSLRHFPIHDEAHVRNAMARMSQSPFGEKARAKIMAAARRFGIGMEGKAFGELKAEPMTSSQLDRWLRGDIPRRILVVPFGGPIPMKGAPLGVDLDGEWFDADSDLYGSYPALRLSRERLVDWHHVTFGGRVDPIGGRMKGAILGRIELDEDPEDDGVWADFWANAGEQRRKLVAELERRQVPLYGSSQPIAGAVAKTDGHIDVWPIIRHTITTSPQNTWAVVPSLKAVLAADNLPLDEIGFGALKAAMLGLADNLADLRPTFLDEAADTFLLEAASDAAKAGRVLSAKHEAELQAAIESLAAIIARMRGELPIGENTDARH